jgi:histone H3/H4
LKFELWRELWKLARFYFSRCHIHKAKTMRVKKTPVKNATVGTKLLQMLRKNRRAKPGQKAVREIKRYQKSDKFMLPRTSFQRLVREIGQQFKTNLNWSSDSMEALQVASEAYLTDVFVDADLCARHAGRETLLAKDVRIATRIREGPHARNWDAMEPVGAEVVHEEEPVAEQDENEESAAIV